MGEQKGDIKKDIDSKEDEPIVKPKKKKGKMITVGIVVAVIILLGVGGSFFYFTKSAAGKTTKDTEPVTEKAPSVMFPLDTFVVNLTDPNMEKYLKVSMQLELSHAVPEDAKAQGPKLKDAIIGILTSKSYNDLISTEGRSQLKNEITVAASHIIGSDLVKSVCFTDFVMQ